MELDLSKLNALTPPYEDFGDNNIKTPPEDKNVLQGDLEGLQGIAKTKLEREQSENVKTAAIYKEYQENIRRCGQLRTDITKGIKAGESSYILLLKAIECISLMTGDRLFMDLSREDIKAVYGLGVLEKEPLEQELELVKDRLVKLEQAARRAGEPEDRKRRIQSAIKSHRERVDQIQALTAAPEQAMYLRADSLEMPSPPETITVDDEDTIHKFVEYFNTLEFTPKIVIKFPSGGWFSNNLIRFKGSQRELNITCEDKYDDGYVLIKFNRRYYKTSMISYNNLLDIISRKEIPPPGFDSSAAGYLLEI